MLVRDCESIRRSQFVAGVKRRSMATGASFALKHFLSAPGQCVKLVRIRRRLERIDIQRQRIKLLVAIARPRGWVRQLAEIFSARDELAIAAKQLSILIERRVAHQVSD